jgi:hypothetical protein
MASLFFRLCGFIVLTVVFMSLAKNCQGHEPTGEMTVIAMIGAGFIAFGTPLGKPD